MPKLPSLRREKRIVHKLDLLHKLNWDISALNDLVAPLPDTPLSSHMNLPKIKLATYKLGIEVCLTEMMSYRHKLVQKTIKLLRRK